MRACPRCNLLLEAAESVCPRDRVAGEEVVLAAVPPAVAARYGGIEPFAHGATGTSYRAVHGESGTSGVLKVLLDAGVSERGRLKRELRKQAKLVNNSLVRILDGGEEGTTLWLFRDHAKGESLATRLARDGKLELLEALAITAQIASALDELHRAGLLHRDVEPGHVILEARPDAVPLVRVIDSGIAARIATGSALEPLGTVGYVAPEQIDGKLVSFRSDLYSLGCVLYEMLAGAPPFAGSIEDVLRAHRETAPPKLELELPPQVASLLGALLAKEPRARPFSAQQVRRTLEPLLPSSMPPAHSATQTSAGEVSAPPPGRPGSGAPAPFAAPFAPEQRTEALDTAALARHGIAGSPPPPPPAARSSRTSVPPPVPGSAASRQSVPPPVPPAAQATEELDLEEVAVPEPEEQEKEAVTVVMRDAQLVKELTASASEAATAPASEPPATGEFPIDGSGDAAPAAPARPSVNFDVESLFDDGGAAKPVGAAEPVVEPAASLEPAERPAGARRFPVIPLAVAAFVAIAVVVAIGLPGGESSSPSAPPPPASSASAAVRSEAPTARADEKVEKERAVAEPAPVEAKPVEAEGAPEGEAAAGTGAPSEAAEAEGAEGEPSAEPEAAAAAPEPKAGPGAPSDEARDPTPVPTRGGSPASTAGSARGSPADRKAKAEALKTEAREHYEAGRYAQAAKAYEQATRQMPSDAGAYAGLGASLLAQGDPDGAIQAYQRAATITPKSSGFHAALGRAYEQKKDLDRARAAYRKALELSPNNLAASRGLARVGGGE